MASIRMFVAALAVTVGVAVTGIQGQTSDIFDPTVLHRVDLNLHSADWAKLKLNFQTNDYYPADLTWNGQTVRNVGIRSRGRGSRSGIKPGLRIDFDRYAVGQEYLGQKHLVLRNHTQDPSAIHENTAMWFYARMGVNAPRTAHARFYVNGEYSGLYTIVEEIDKKLLARLFGIIEADTQNDGYLFEYNWVDEWHGNYLGSALDPYKLRFTAKTHENGTDEALYRPIEELVRLFNDTPPASFIPTVSDRLDLTQFVRYLAVQSFLAENDGWVGFWGVNNFFIYRLEGQVRHVFIAWDASEAFLAPNLPVELRIDTNVLARKLLEIPQFRDTFIATLNEAADVAAEIPAGSTVGALETEIRRELDLIDAAIREDTLKPYTDDEFVREGNAMKQFASGRISFVKCEVDRMRGMVSSC
ncbi:MAG: CotH kinase family protein [Vicinamibacterales bacterium]